MRLSDLSREEREPRKADRALDLREAVPAPEPEHESEQGSTRSATLAGTAGLPLLALVFISLTRRR